MILLLCHARCAKKEGAFLQSPLLRGGSDGDRASKYPYNKLVLTRGQFRHLSRGLVFLAPGQGRLIANNGSSSATNATSLSQAAPVKQREETDASGNLTDELANVYLDAGARGGAYLPFG